MGAPGDGPLGGSEGTGVYIFHIPALIADEVMMMRPEPVRQLIAGESLLELQAAGNPQRTEDLDGSVDRDAIDRAVPQACVNLLDAERLRASYQHA